MTIYQQYQRFVEIAGKLVPVTVYPYYPPIPFRGNDWAAWYSHDQSDAPDCGWGATAEDAIENLLDSVEDPENDNL